MSRADSRLQPMGPQEVASVSGKPEAHPLVGQIVFVQSNAMMLEIWLASDLLDIAAAHVLNMEGGLTGRDVHFRPSVLVCTS